MIQAHIVLGAPLEKQLKFDISRKKGDIYVGVDKGALRLIKANIKPNLSIGDFDSTSTEEFEKIEQQSAKVEWFNSNKDDTDAELALEYTEKLFEPDSITIHNWRGGRLDHFMSLLYLVYQPRFKKIIHRVKFVDETNTLTYFKPGTYTIEQEEGKNYLSFIGVTKIEGLTLKNVKYTLDEATYKYPTALISNEFIGKTAEFSFKKGIVAVIQSKD